MIEVRCSISKEDIEKVEDFLCEEETNWMIYTEEVHQLFNVVGYYPNPEEAKIAWEEITQILDFLKEPTFTPIEDKDWKEAYKDHFTPWNYKSIHWVPNWEKESYQLPKDHKAIYIDPGMAFGTGNHPTTRLCALAIVDYIQAKTDSLNKINMIDAGCGSGILSISAKALGLKNIHAFDIDEDSIRISKENALENEIEGVQFFHAGFELMDQLPLADLLVANIQSNILIPNKEVLIKQLAPNSFLALSGILNKELEEVQQEFEVALSDKNYDIGSTSEGEWSALYIELKN